MPSKKISLRPDRTHRLLKVSEVAELDGVSEKTVRRAIAGGLLKVLRVGPGGRLIRVTPEALGAYRHRCGR